MEIARLEVSTQQHLDRMQDTAKVNYVQYGKSTKSKKGKKLAQSGKSGANYRGDRGHGTSSKPGGKGKKLLYILLPLIFLTNKNAFQSKAHLPLADRKSSTYNLTLE